MNTEFSKEIIEKLNKQQQDGKFHPYTCNRNFPECEVVLDPSNYLKDGILIATEKGWICPCGKYKQNWYL